MRGGIKALAAAALLLLTAVSASAAPGPITRVDPGHHGPPGQVLGLDVQKEEVTKVLATDRRALYVDRVGLYSFRENKKLLQATLEIARFRAQAPASTTDFQLSIVGHLGTSVPIVVRVDGQPVYITNSKGLTLAVWFKDNHMMVLSIRRTFTQPKELLRRSLAINP